MGSIHHTAAACQGGPAAGRYPSKPELEPWTGLLHHADQVQKYSCVSKKTTSHVIESLEPAPPVANEDFMGALLDIDDYQVSQAPVVYLVDDDDVVRNAIMILLSIDGHKVKEFGSGVEFLEFCTEDMKGCAVVDLMMTEIDGIALQEALIHRGINLPIIFLSGHADTPSVVRAMQAGALDFLTKPVEINVLIKRVAQALRLSERMQKLIEVKRAAFLLLNKLTKRERQILELLVTGHTSEEIGSQLGISVNTVREHRSHITNKAGASNFLELAYCLGALDSHQTV
jgi:FixJ family two-component response regulator